MTVQGGEGSSTQSSTLPEEEGATDGSSRLSWGTL
jgi:hypothetical protein